MPVAGRKEKRKFLIDTDTASDDAVALLMALLWPDVQVLAVTVVSGNVPVDQGVSNALYTLELAGADCPVHRGADRPLTRPAQHAEFFHGNDGLGDVGYRPRRLEADPEPAVDAIVRIVGENPGLTLVTLGPLTNLALALERNPELAGGVGRCVVMGGAACTVGNVTPAAEYNVWCDPEAARQVFRSGLSIEMVGWELCRKEANLLRREMDRLRAMDTPLARFTLDCNRTALEANFRQSGDPGLALPDAVAMAVALDPSICTRKSLHYVDVETDSELTRGMTVVDALGVAGDSRNRPHWEALTAEQPHVTVCWSIDVQRWKKMLFLLLAAGAADPESTP